MSSSDDGVQVAAGATAGAAAAVTADMTGLDSERAAGLARTGDSVACAGDDARDAVSALMPAPPAVSRPKARGAGVSTMRGPMDLYVGPAVRRPTAAYIRTPPAAVLVSRAAGSNSGGGSTRENGLARAAAVANKTRPTFNHAASAGSVRALGRATGGLEAAAAAARAVAAAQAHPEKVDGEDEEPPACSPQPRVSAASDRQAGDKRGASASPPRPESRGDGPTRLGDVRPSAREPAASGDVSSAQHVGGAAPAVASSAVRVSVPAPASAAAAPGACLTTDLDASACLSSKPGGPCVFPPSEMARKPCTGAEARALFDRLFVVAPTIGAVMCAPCSATMMDVDAAKSHFSRASHKAEEEGAHLGAEERAQARALCRSSLRQRRSDAQERMLRRYTRNPWPQSSDASRLNPLPGLPVYKERWACATCHLVASNSEAEARRAHAKMTIVVDSVDAAIMSGASAADAARTPRTDGGSDSGGASDALGQSDAAGRSLCPGTLFVTDVQTMQRGGHSAFFPVARMAPALTAADRGIPPTAAGQMPLEQYASLRRQTDSRSSGGAPDGGGPASGGRRAAAARSSLPPLQLPVEKQDEAANRYEEVYLLALGPLAAEDGTADDFQPLNVDTGDDVLSVTNPNQVSGLLRLTRYDKAISQLGWTAGAVVARLRLDRRDERMTRRLEALVRGTTAIFQDTVQVLGRTSMAARRLRVGYASRKSAAGGGGSWQKQTINAHLDLRTLVTYARDTALLLSVVTTLAQEGELPAAARAALGRRVPSFLSKTVVAALLVVRELEALDAARVAPPRRTVGAASRPPLVAGRGTLDVPERG